MTLKFDTLTHLWLEIAPDTQRECWRQSQTLPTPAGRWAAYLHQLCLSTLLQWFRDEQYPVTLADPTTPDLWEIVDGLAISFGKKRLILMPSEAIDIQELRVPQEWVDIPAWAGDYYLAVQVNPDESWLRVWGFTTHQRLKINGQFDNSDRTYSLDNTELIADLNVLRVVQQLNQAELARGPLAPMPSLPLEQANPLLNQIATQTTIPTRLVLSFAQWGALLETPEWRSHVLSQISSQVDNPTTMAEAAESTQSEQLAAASTLTNLSQWFQNVFQAGWLALDEVLDSGNALAYSFRKDAISGEMRRIKLLTFTPIQSSGASPGSLVAATSTEDAPMVALLLSLNREEDGRVEVRAQVRPAPGQTHLPANLVLELLSVADQPLQTVRSRRQDNYIQLKRFKCLPGWQFTLKIEFNGVQIREGFMS
jgi:hypothetical protein